MDPIDELLNRGTAEVIVNADLEKKLRSGKKLRIKLGIDPTGSLLHIGHAVVLTKLRQFQDLGHTVIFLIGDFTAKIGDPTGRVSERKALSDKDIKKNMKDYIRQAGMILDMDKVEVRYNSEWLEKLDLKDMIVLMSKVTYAQVSQRSDFKNRIQNDIDLSLQEFLYPVLQGYDSVALKADVELGGTDQKFNLLMGRQIQKRYDQPEQNVLTCPILEGIYGGDKMSKSLDNYIAMEDAPNDMFGKVMSVPDNLILDYFELATDVPSDQIAEYKKALDGGENPRNVKVELGKAIVEKYHGEEAGESALAEFEKVFVRKERPTELGEIRAEKPEMNIIELIELTGFLDSKSDARRQVAKEQCVSIDGERVTDISHIVKIKEGGVVLQIGKKRFMKIFPYNVD